MKKFAESMGWTLKARATDPRPDWPDSISFHVEISGPRGIVWAGPYSVGKAWPMMWAHKATKGRGRQLWLQYLSAGGTVYAAQGGRHTIVQARIADEITAAFRAAAPLDIADILSSLQCDASGADQPFESWCADLGYDTDSRKALAAYEACRATMFALRNACGDRYAEFLEIES